MSKRITEMDSAMQELLSSGLHDLDLDERIINQLEKAAIYTVEDLLLRTEEDIRKLPNLGDKAMQSIYDCLAAKKFVRYDKVAKNNSRRKT